MVLRFFHWLFCWFLYLDLFFVRCWQELWCCCRRGLGHACRRIFNYRDYFLVCGSYCRRFLLNICLYRHLWSGCWFYLCCWRWLFLGTGIGCFSTIWAGGDSLVNLFWLRAFPGRGLPAKPFWEVLFTCAEVQKDFFDLFCSFVGQIAKHGLRQWWCWRPLSVQIQSQQKNHIAQDHWNKVFLILVSNSVTPWKNDLTKYRVAEIIIFKKVCTGKDSRKKEC